MIQVREHAVLTSDKSKSPSLDVGIVSTATITWLKELKRQWSSDYSIMGDQKAQSIKLSSYVGFLQSPCGESIEVLPKTHHNEIGETQQLRNRMLLRRMLASALDVPPREAGVAELDRFSTPIHEWIFSRFLAELSSLVKRGLKFDYLNIEEESRFLRGKLDQARQMSRTPDKLARFHIRHDIYSPERVENRLLRTALVYVLSATKNSDNWRKANELNHLMLDIRQSSNPLSELTQWNCGKLMISYENVKPWCEIILEKMNPAFQRGMHGGISLLFPMERLFERYVIDQLRKHADNGWFLRSQASSEYLVKHSPSGLSEPRPWFQLKPDILLVKYAEVRVLDAKWKLLDSSLTQPDKKYNLAQADFYQLFAYGHKYMGGAGDMMLIYPKNEKFDEPLPVFEYQEGLRLWVVPFDLEVGKLVQGEWCSQFPFSEVMKKKAEVHVRQLQA